MNKNIAVAALVIVAVVGTGYYAWWSIRVPLETVQPSALPVELPQLSSEVEAVVKQKIELVSIIASAETVVSVIKKESQKNSTLSTAQIDELDQVWRKATEADPLVKSISENPGSAYLKEFQIAHPEFTEIFVTDIRGLNAAETNKTSDYYQADEEWWTRTFNGGIGSTYYGAIEFDESAQSEAIPIYIPILGADSHVIGVVKAILDLSAVKQSI